MFSSMTRSLIGNLISLKPNSLSNILSAFRVLDGLRSVGYKYLTNHHLEHSLSLIFLMLLKPFFGWSNPFGD